MDDPSCLLLLLTPPAESERCCETLSPQEHDFIFSVFLHISQWWSSGPQAELKECSNGAADFNTGVFTLRLYKSSDAAAKHTNKTDFQAWFGDSLIGEMLFLCERSQHAEQ